MLYEENLYCVQTCCFFHVRLFQVKMEREQYQTEIRDMQDQLSEMHDELDSAKRSAADDEKDILMTVSCSVPCCRKHHSVNKVAVNNSKVLSRLYLLFNLLKKQ